jgi:hypothetical protein
VLHSTARQARGVERLARAANTGPIWRFGVFEVDAARREELRRSGALVKMREQSLRIPVYLREHPFLGVVRLLG